MEVLTGNLNFAGPDDRFAQTCLNSDLQVKNEFSVLNQRKKQRSNNFTKERNLKNQIHMLKKANRHS
jgi:hypothetical protein